MASKFASNVKYEKWLEKDNLLLLKGWARDGLIDKQIAHNMGIAVSTLHEWKKKYPELSESLKKGKEVVDMEVENALCKSAKGYYVDETKEIMEKDEDGQYTKLRVEKTKKWIAANTAAQIFWLKNRKPDTWRDRPEVNENERDDKKHKEWIAKTSGDKEEGLFDEYEE